MAKRVIGAATPFGPFLAVGKVSLASLWLWFTINGYLAARQRQFAQHRRHMVRSTTPALSIITSRIWTPVLVITFQPLQDSVFGGNEGRCVWFVGGWLGWTIPLFTVQGRLNRKTVVSPSSISQLTYTPRV